MKIGIIGAGNIGATAARLFAVAGHEILISNSRGPETLKNLISEIGERARAGTVEEAAQFGDVVLVAIPFGKYATLPANAFKNKIVIDATNYYPQRDGQFKDFDAGAKTSSELVSEHLREARLVKAFNTMYSGHLAEAGDTDLPPGERRALFLAGDDSEAKQTVARLIEEIGFAAVDTGFLREGGARQQPGTLIYNFDTTGAKASELLAEGAV